MNSHISWTSVPTGLPPDSLVVDHQRLYWLNKTDHVVKSVDKFTGQNLVLETSGNITTLVAYSYLLQPEPGRWSHTSARSSLKSQ